MSYIPWWQRMSPPTFAERFDLGGLAGRVGFSDGTEPRKIYKVIRSITTQDRKMNPDIPEKARWKIQLPGSKIQGGTGQSSTQMVYGETKGDLNKALKASEKIKYVKPKLPHNDPNHPLYEPFVPHQEKFLVKKNIGRVKENINKIIYEEVLGSKNHPETYKKTGKIVTKFKPMIGVEKITIPGEGANTLKEAQTFVDDYFEKNPKKVIVKDPDAPKKSKDLKKQKIIAAKGAPLWLTGSPEVHKGHGTTVADPEITIKPSNIFATPEKINVDMAPKKIKDVKEIKTSFTDLDFKIAEMEKQAKEIKNSNLPDSEKISKLNAIDKKLTGYAFDSKGYKTVRLSDGTMFNSGQASTQSYDIADIFPPDWSEAKTKKFVSKYFTEEGKLKSQWTKGNISHVDKVNIQKSYVFLENVKNAKANAAKIAKKIIKEELPKQTLKKTDFSKKTVVMMRMRDGLAKLYNKIPLKGVRLGASSAAAVLDYSFFHYVMGVPSAAAATGAALWFVKNPKEAAKISSALMAMSAGEMSVDEFIGKHGATLVGISSDAVLSETPPREKGAMVWKQGILEVADNMARGGLSGVDQYMLNRYK